MFTTLRTAGLMGGLLFLSHDAVLDLPTLAPEAGSSVTRSVEFAVDLELQSLTIEQNGESQTMEVESSQAIRQNWTAKDTFGKSADGRIERFVRAYEGLSANMSNTDPDGETTSEESSELNDKQVVFTWDKESAAYTRAYAEGFEGDEALLEELQGDLDLSYLLPSSELEVDESYVVDLKLFSEVLDFGGELHFKGEDDEDEESAQQQSLKEAIRNLTGEVKATFKGLTEGDGQRLYTLSFEFEVTGTGDASSEIEQPEDAPMEISGEESVGTEMNYVGTAELLWDLEAKRLSSFSLEAELTLVLNNNATMSIEGQGEMTFAQKIELAGPFSITVTVE